MHLHVPGKPPQPIPIGMKTTLALDAAIAIVKKTPGAYISWICLEGYAPDITSITKRPVIQGELNTAAQQ